MRGVYRPKPPIDPRPDKPVRTRVVLSHEERCREAFEAWYDPEGLGTPPESRDIYKRHLFIGWKAGFDAGRNSVDTRDRE